MNRPSLTSRAIATALTAAALLVSMEAPSFARSHRATPSAAPVNGEALKDVIPKLEQAFAQHPADAQVGAQLADAYVQAQRPDLALNVTQRFINSGQRTAPILYFTGEAYTQQHKNTEALAAFQAAERVDPTSETILIALTDAYMQQGRIEDALREAKRNTTFNVRDERAHMNYGMVLAVARQLDAARAEFVAAQSLAPQDARPLILIGRTYMDSNDPQRAVDSFNRALQLDPKNLSVLEGLSNAYLVGRNPQAAVNTLERALTVVTDPQQKVGVMAQEAHILMAAGQPQLADQALKRAVAQFPNLDVAHLAYGDFLGATGHLPEAKDQWMTAAGPQGNNPAALSRLGNLALQTNQAEAAVNIFTRIVSANQNDDNAWNSLGQAYLVSRKVDEATNAFRKAYNINRTPDALSGIATCDYMTHNYGEAQQIFDVLQRQAGQYVANNPRLLFTMGRTYAATNQKDKARAAFGRLLSIVAKNSDEERYVRGLLANLDARPRAQEGRRAHPAARGR